MKTRCTKGHYYARAGESRTSLGLDSRADINQLLLGKHKHKVIAR